MQEQQNLKKKLPKKLNMTRLFPVRLHKMLTKGSIKRKRFCFCSYLTVTVDVKRHVLHLAADVLLVSADK